VLAANHPAIFSEAGLAPTSMRYYNESTLGLDIDGLLEDMRAAAPGTTVVLHACAHNPTGVDPTEDQWRLIAQVCQEGQLLTIFDCAYLGFVTGEPEEDAFAMRLWAQLNLSFFICMSFSKNFGLYSERCGVTLYVGSTPKEATAVNSQLKVIGRPIWSVPPMHGAVIVERILTDPDLHNKWRYELKGQAQRILRMRQKLHQGLTASDPEHNWDHIIKQTGMFTYTGLSKEQCEELISEYSIYLLDTGRINVSGIPADAVDYLVDAICSVVNRDTDAASVCSLDMDNEPSSASSAEVNEAPSAKL
jgi:aspartate/tyrosine/aromatic aminotransferase